MNSQNNILNEWIFLSLTLSTISSISQVLWQLYATTSVVWTCLTFWFGIEVFFWLFSLAQVLITYFEVFLFQAFQNCIFIMKKSSIKQESFTANFGVLKFKRRHTLRIVWLLVFTFILGSKPFLYYSTVHYVSYSRVRQRKRYSSCAASGFWFKVNNKYSILA